MKIRKLLSIFLVLVIVVCLLSTLSLAAEDAGGEETVPVEETGSITRAELTEKVYSNAKLKNLIDLAAEGPEPDFTDIGDDYCTADQQTAIKKLYQAKILSGTSENTFSPTETVTRAQAAVVIWRAAGSRSNRESANLPYADLTGRQHETQWYAAAINCLFAMGVLTDDDGITEGDDLRFNPDGEATKADVDKWLSVYSSLSDEVINQKTVSGGITRAEMAVLVYNDYKDILPAIPEDNTTQFVDISGCTQEQKDAIVLFSSLKLKNGSSIISGLNTQIPTFAPYAAASNAQTAVFLQRVITYIEENAAGPDTAALSGRDSLELRSTIVRYEGEWYASAVAFLQDRGLTSAADTTNGNPHAPAVDTALKSWSGGLKPAEPVISPSGGAYSAAQIVTITTGEDSTVYYTLDGNDPTTASTSYSGPFTVSNATVKAIAVRNGLISEVAEAIFTLQTTTPLPIDPVPVPGSGSSGVTSSRDDDDGGYTVSVPASTSIKNGSITVSPRSAEKGDAVTITVRPDDGYVLDTLTVTDASGKAVELTGKGDGKYTFTMPASGVRVRVSFTVSEETVERRFADIPNGYWAEDEISWAAGNGYINGNTAATFSPEGTVTRQQLWIILARLAGEQPADFTEAKDWAVSNWLSDGTSPGTAVSRQQLVTILYRYAVGKGYDTADKADLTRFPDHASVASYAADAMGWSVANSIVGGTTQGTLSPNGTATRAQFAVILNRFADKMMK